MKSGFIALFVFHTATIMAQSPIGCFHFGGNAIDYANAVVRDADDSLLIAGGSASYAGSAFQTTYLVRTGSDAAAEWSKAIDAGITSNDFTTSIIATSDGGYLLAGSSSGFAGVLTKLDAAGAVQWCRSYNTGGAGSRYFNCVVQTDDGGFVAAGVGSISTSDTWVMKTDADGVMQWSKLFGYSGGSQQAFAVIEAADSGFVVVGQAPVDGIVTHRLDDDGTLMWAKAYGGPSDLGSAVVLMPDSGFAIAGRTGHFGFANSGDFQLDGFVVRVDKLGELLWARAFGDTLSEQFEDLTLTQDGGLAMTGFITDPPVGVNPRYAYVAKCDANGIAQWAIRSSPYSRPTQGLAMLEGSGGALTIVGRVSVGSNTHAFLLGLEADGTTCPECGITDYGSDLAAVFAVDDVAPIVTNAPVTVTDIVPVEYTGDPGTVYCTTTGTPDLAHVAEALGIAPNPFIDNARVEVPALWLADRPHLEVRDVLGRVVSESPTAATSFTLDRGSLVPGTYTVRCIGVSGKVYGAVRAMVQDMR
jgi:hypothetical protein